MLCRENPSGLIDMAPPPRLARRIAKRSVSMSRDECGLSGDHDLQTRSVSRRSALAMSASVAAAMLLLDSRAIAATDADAATRIVDFSAGKPAVSGKVTIDLPDIAENGNSVPLSVLVDSPMTPDDHVTEVLVVADRNPRPVVATFHFTPAMARAEAATRIRLAATQTVTAAAKTSKGALFVDSRPVKVTIGGCGG